MIKTKNAFTLAEVLITLAIIGVVAAVIMPTLMKNINDRVLSTKKSVMDRKIVNSLNMLTAQEDGLKTTYSSTLEFVQALSKYMKLTACGTSNLQGCFTTKKINYDSNGTIKDVDVSSITTASKMKLEGNWLEPASFIMADGTPFIISFNNDCKDLIGDNKILKDVPTACIDGVYDNNGAKAPNQYGVDILPLFAAKIGGSCLTEAGGICIAAAAASPQPVPLSEMCPNAVLDPKYSAYGIGSCCTNDKCPDGDYWAGATIACQDKGLRLPTVAELAKIASTVYGREISVGTTYRNINMNKSALLEIIPGLPNKTYYSFWSSDPYSSWYYYDRSMQYILLQKNYVYTNSISRGYGGLLFFCVSDEN